MNVAMIMCHKNPAQVIRLASRFMTNTTNVVIHCDKNMSEKDYASIVQFVTSNPEKVFLTDDRIHCELDRRSLVDATMRMIARAKSVEKVCGKKYNYYMLLSGQDYPIKSVDWIESELKREYPTPYIDCTPCDKNNWVYPKFQISKYGLQLSRYTRTLKKGIVRDLFRIIRKIYLAVIRKCGLTEYKWFCRKRIEVYGGSAWWILPDLAIDYIYDIYQSNSPVVSKILDGTYTPEETFFQILTMLSPVSARVHLNPCDQVSQSCKTFAYFSDVGKPFKGHPYTITSNMVDRLVKSDFWIARKFDINEDAGVFDLMDEAAGGDLG